MVFIGCSNCRRAMMRPYASIDGLQRRLETQRKEPNVLAGRGGAKAVKPFIPFAELSEFGIRLKSTSYPGAFFGLYLLLSPGKSVAHSIPYHAKIALRDFFGSIVRA